MSFRQKDGLRYYSFDVFPDTLTQAVFTRQGGVSPTPWNSLNTGGSVGDDPKNVAQNRERIFRAMGRSADSIADIWLVHGKEIHFAESLRPLNSVTPYADIVLTDNPAVTLFMRFGDCVPVLLHDPQKKVVGIAHAGWQGTLRGVVGAAISGMAERYGSRPQDILAGVGPSIGADHYEVGVEVIQQFQRAYPQHSADITQERGGSRYLDLWQANALQLREAGVEQIQVSQICTACHLDDWYSHRAEKGKTGRFAAIMALAH